MNRRSSHGTRLAHPFAATVSRTDRTIVLSIIFAIGLEVKRRRAACFRPRADTRRPADARRHQGTLWMAKHVVDFRRGYELANLDVTQPFTLAANWAADD